MVWPGPPTPCGWCGPASTARWASNVSRSRRASTPFAHFLVTNLHVADQAVRTTLHEGLFAWDAGFYRGIAVHGYGYGAIPGEAVRFFPLFPLAGRGLGVVLGGHADWALLVLANGSALVMAALLHRLVLVEKHDPALARRAAWLVALVP